MRRVATTIIPISLLATACGTLPGLSNDAEQRSGADAESLQFTTEPPGSGYERLNQMTGYAEGECEGPRAESNRARARADLRQRAAASGAAYVRVLGVGPLAERGHCQDDTFRVSGIPYAPADETGTSDQQAADATADNNSKTESSESQPSPDRQPQSGAEGNASTADKLEELEALREKDLISEAEYERLRERILDDAF